MQSELVVTVRHIKEALENYQAQRPCWSCLFKSPDEKIYRDLMQSQSIVDLTIGVLGFKEEIQGKPMAELSRFSTQLSTKHTLTHQIKTTYEKYGKAGNGFLCDALKQWVEILFPAEKNLTAEKPMRIVVAQA